LPATVADIGLTAKDVHEARQIRDAERGEKSAPEVLDQIAGTDRARLR
jgi:hypothetical protein